MTGEALVLHSGVVATGPQWRPRAADVLVVDGLVIAVGDPGAFDHVDAARHDATGRLLVPGTIDAHTHSHSRHARGVARDWTLEVSLLHGPWMATERDAELAELSARLTAAELLASGCTALVDLVGVPDTSAGAATEMLAAVATGHARAGIRAVVAPMLTDRSLADSVPALASACGHPVTGMDPDRLLAVAAAHLRRPLPPGVRAGLAPSIPAQCTPEFLQALAALAREHGAGLHTHLAESRVQARAGRARFGRSITAELHRLGVLAQSLTAAHALWLEDGDLAMLADAGVALVTVPGSNLRLGSGVADVRAWLDAGVVAGIGTDGANSADAYDQLDAVRLAALMCRVTQRPPQEWLSPAEVLDAATTGGAAAGGWSGVGRIAPGHTADIALHDLTSSAFRPANDLVNQLLTAARAADVRDVLVGGRWVLRDRVPVGFDPVAAAARFDELAAELHERGRPARDIAQERARAADGALAAAGDPGTDRRVTGGR